MIILITGGAGFIGSAVIRHMLNNTEFDVVNVDNLTYAGNLDSLPAGDFGQRYNFEQIDICDASGISEVFDRYKPTLVMHLAAESHVDRSIESPEQFILTNILGTYNMLEKSRIYFSTLSDHNKKKFRFHHISTDEVFGDLEGASNLFTETTPYAPSSPYSASKASSDHLVRSWARTYDLPCIITNCSNNYGPYHFPEKLIPNTILNALMGKPLHVYGNGLQVRDWLYVDDHARALVKVATDAAVGSTYNIGGHNEKTNIEVVETICDLLEDMVHEKPAGVKNYRDLIKFVVDRPGHDVRYAVDASKIEAELDWVPQESFNSGLRKTVQWYMDNPEWWGRVLSGDYRQAKIGN